MKYATLASSPDKTAYRRAAMALRGLAFGAAVALAGGPVAAQAQVRPDGSTRTAVVAAANGVPVVNIAAPNAAGLSHNRYGQFDIASQGLVLNNSGAVVSTKLAGYVYGNPNLASGAPARLILNEITSSLPSQLNGVAEVAGSAAEVIVANPNGIHCSGCGFINASRATLATGTPVLGADGGLSALRVSGGSIDIDGQGLDGSAVDRVDLVARAVNINAGVWAGRELNVVAGANQVDYASLAASKIAGSGAAPAVALDVSALGGMYAGVIRLVGTEAGLGVHSAGTLAAQNGDLTLTSAGDVVLSGQATATGTVTVGAAQAVNNGGSVTAGGALSLNGGGDVSNSGTLYSGGAMNLAAGGQLTNSGQVQAQGGALAVQAGGAFANTAGGTLYAAGTVGVNAATLDQAGALEAGQGATLAAAGAASNSGTVQTDAGDLHFTSGGDLANSGTLNVAGHANLGAAGTLSNGGTIVAGGSLASNAASIANTGALSAAGDASLSATGSLSNSGTVVATGSLAMNAAAIANSGGAQGGNTLQLGGGSLVNSGKLYALDGDWTSTLAGAVTNQAGGQLYAGGALDLGAASLANAGLVQGGGAVTLAAAVIDNAGRIQAGTDLATRGNRSLLDEAAGQLLAAGDVNLDTAGALTNAGTIQAGGNLAIDGGSVDNQAGATLYAASQASLQLGGALANAGTLYGAQGLQLAAASLDNGGTLRSDADLSAAIAGDAANGGTAYALGRGDWTVGGALSNDGVLAAAGDLAIQAGSLGGAGTLAAGLAADGTLGDSGRLTAATNGLLAAHGAVLAGGDLGLAGNAIDLSDSQVRAGGDAVLAASAGDVNNAGGDLAANGSLAIDATGALVNGGADATQGGQLSAATLALNVASLDNRYGSLTQSGSGDLALALAGDFDNAHGSFAANAGDLSIQAAALDNSGGAIEHAGTGTLSLSAAGDLLDVGGRIAGNGGLALHAGGKLDDSQGSIGVAGDVDLGAQSLANAGGTLAGQDVNLDVAQAFGNAGGTVQAAGTLGVTAASLDNTGGFLKATGDQALSLATTGVLTNGAGGFIGGNGAVSVQAGSLANAGQVYAGTTLGVTTTGALTNNGGALQAQGALDVRSGASLSNRQGRIEAGSGDAAATLAVHAATLDNTGGRIADTGTGLVTLATTGSMANQGGTLGGQGSVTLDASSLDDSNAGHLVAGQDLTLALGSLNNAAGGTVYAARDLGWSNSGAGLTNTNGSVGAGGNLALTLASVSNGGGELAADNDVTLSLGSLGGAGRAEAGQDLTLTLSGSYTNAAGNQLKANRNLVLNIGGDFANAAGASLAAVGGLTLNAGNVDNAVGADIDSAATTLNARGNLSNEGRIEGDRITLGAQTLTNTATIIGGAITVNAANLTNGADLGAATDNAAYQSALIAATGDIALYVGGTVLNRDATLFTTSNLTIAADAAGNRSAAVTNDSGDIEADGNLVLSANQFTNTRRVFETQTVAFDAGQQAQNTVVDTPVVRYAYNDSNANHQPPNVDPSQVVSADELAVANTYCSDHAESNTQRCVGEQAISFQGQETDTVVSETILARTSAESRLLAGGNITINGSVLNDKSTIAAGQNLTIDGQSGGDGNSSVQNIAWAPTVEVSRTLDEQVEFQHLQHSPRRWVGGDFQTYGSAQSSVELGLADAASKFSGLLASASGDANITAGNNVSITAHTIDNTAVDADGNPVHNAIGLGSNGAGQVVGGSAVGMVGAVSGATGGSGGVALGSSPQAGSLGAQTVPGLAGGGSASSIQLPQSGLYTVHSDPSSPYLVETDPRFTDYSQFVSSDYMLEKLGENPSDIQKRLGDGFYEERSVLDQITDLTGHRYLDDNSDAMAQYQQLMDNGVQVAQQFDLSVGVALTPEQMANLTEDMVWMVDETVDGQQVLTPVVYLSAEHAQQLASGGATISGKNVTLTTDGDLTNNGTIAASQAATVKAGDLLNSGNLSAGGDLSVTAAQDILNGGTISAGGSVSLVAGNDVRSGVDVAQSLGAANLTDLGKPVGQVALTGTQPGSISAGGSLGISAGQDLSLDHASVSAGGDLGLAAGRDLSATASAISAGGDAQLVAGQDLTLGASGHTVGQGGIQNGTESTTHTVSTVTAGGNAVLAAGQDLTSQGAQVSAGDQLGVSAGRDLDVTAVTDTRLSASQTVSGQKVIDTRTSDETVRGSDLTAANGVGLAAGRDATLTASTVSSDQGAVSVAAGRDVTLDTADEAHSWEQDTKKSSGGLLSSTTTKTHDEVTDTYAVGSVLSGDSVTVAAGHDLTAQAAQIAGTHDVVLAAGNDLTLTTATDTHSEEHGKSVSKSGVMGGGGFNVVIGGSKQSEDDTLTQTTPTGSLVGSTDGSVTLSAGNDVHITGSDVLSQTGTTIVGKDVTIDAAVGSTDTTQSQKVSQSGITVGLSGGAANIAVDAGRSLQRSSQVSDDRLKDLYIAKAAYDAKDMASAVSGMEQSGSVLGQNGKPGSVNLEIGIGGSSASSKASTHDETAYGSTIRSQGDVTIAATGGDLDVVGSTISGDNVALAAANNLNFLSQEEEHSLKNDSKNGSGGIGISVGSDGLGIYAQAAVGSGQAHGNGTTHAQSHVDASGTLSLVSGNDTTIQGAQLTGQQVLASVGHDLNIVSEQDTDDYASKSMQAGGKVMVGFTQSGFVSGSAYLSEGKVDSHYASVNEVSGIQAGDGGFDIVVGNHTGLVGGQIASTADPSQNYLSTGSLSYQDIQNESKYSASQTSISGGSSMSDNIAGGIGAGLSLAMPQHGNSSSTTQSGIASGTIDVRGNPGQDLSGLDRDLPTLDGNGIKDGFDPQKVAENQELGQVAGYVGMRSAGSIANYMYNQAQLNGDEAGQKAWGDGGIYKDILHGLVGAATAALGNGDVGGAVRGAVAGEAVSQVMQDFLVKQGIKPDDPMFNTLMELGSAAVGAVAGGGAGASVALQGDQFNRQLHPSEVTWIKAHAEDFAKQQCGGCDPSDAQIEQATKDLSQQAARQTDVLWSATMPGDDGAARQFLAGAQGTFVNQLGNAQQLFTTQGDQFLNPFMYLSDAENNLGFYQKYVQPGVSQGAGSGLQQMLNAAGQYAVDHPGSTAWNIASGTATGLAELVSHPLDAINGAGQTIGDTVASGLYPGLYTNMLTSVYGQDVSTAAAGLSAVNSELALLSVTGTGKAAGALIENAAKSEALATMQQALSNALKSGAVEDAAPVASAAADAEAGTSVAVTNTKNTGRYVPNNLKEQLAMEQAVSDPEAGIVIPLKNGLTDPRWPESDGWVKMSQNINGVEIHYVRNTNTGAVDDFKFK